MGKRRRTQASDILALGPLSFRVSGEEREGEERRGGAGRGRGFSHVSPPMGSRLGMGRSSCTAGGRTWGREEAGRRAERSGLVLGHWEVDEIN